MADILTHVRRLPRRIALGDSASGSVCDFWFFLDKFSPIHEIYIFAGLYGIGRI